MIFYREEGAFDNYMIILHGLGEHSGRYWPLIERALKEKISVITFDLPGHGKSGGVRGHTTLKKVFKIIDNIVNRLSTSPIIFGHSLGGLIAARYVENGGKAKMLILSSPGFTYDKNKVSPSLVKLAKFLAKFVPFLTMNNRIDPKKLSRNADSVDRYLKDPLVHDRISVALASDFFEESEKAVKEASKITIPTLVLIGTADEITPPDGAKEFYRNLKNVEAKDKKIIEYDGAYHEIFEDEEHKERFYDDIFNFIKEHL